MEKVLQERTLAEKPVPPPRGEVKSSSGPSATEGKIERKDTSPKLPDLERFDVVPITEEDRVAVARTLFLWQGYAQKTAAKLEVEASRLSKIPEGMGDE